MRRHEFITLFSGASTWPLTARAQQPNRERRIGVLMGYGENDTQATTSLSAFTHVLAELGWTDGRNVRMDSACRPVENRKQKVLIEQSRLLMPYHSIGHLGSVACKVARARNR